MTSRWVVELQAEPVPAELVRCQDAGEEFLVHPAFAADLPRLAVEAQLAAGAEPGEAVVQAGAGAGLRFAAVAVGALEDEWLNRPRGQRKGHRLRVVAHVEIEAAAVPRQAPLIGRAGRRSAPGDQRLGP